MCGGKAPPRVGSQLCRCGREGGGRAAAVPSPRGWAVGEPPALPPRTVPSGRAWAVGPAPVRRPGRPSHAAGSGEEAAAAASRPLPGRLAAGDGITRPPRAAESGTPSLGKSPGECCSPGHRGLRGEGGRRGRRELPRTSALPEGPRGREKNPKKPNLILGFVYGSYWGTYGFWQLVEEGARTALWERILQHRCRCAGCVPEPSARPGAASLLCVPGVFNGDQLKSDFFFLLHLLAVKNSRVSVRFPLAKC